MDLSQFEAVEKAYTVKKKRASGFRIKWNPSKQHFKLSDELIADTNLAENSLQQFNLEDGPDKGIYLMVKGGNSGVFYKKKSTGKKGNQFKNEMLTEALIRHGFGTASQTMVELDMLFIEETAQGNLYRIVAIPPHEEVTSSDGEDQALGVMDSVGDAQAAASAPAEVEAVSERSVTPEEVSDDLPFESSTGPNIPTEPRESIS